MLQNEHTFTTKAWEPALSQESHPRALRAASMVQRLSRRQRQVLEGVAAGLLNKQIAYSLRINEKTVKMHRSLLLGALGVRTSAEAIRIHVEASFLEQESIATLSCGCSA